jgi:23S rRNA pseudouridine2605 synthase
MRIAKYISNAGYCSRRDAEKLILSGKVYINDILCEKPNVNVNPNDKIVIEKKLIKLTNNIRLWKIYKPPRIICTNKDPQKRKTIFDILPNDFPRVISVGRLDFMSEGLLLLTNNGDYARKLELPSSDVLRIYRLCLKGDITTNMIKQINRNISINGINYKKISAKIEKFQNPYTWMIFKLKEGKNREIRNICKFFKWNIIKLIRIQYGTIKLSKQKMGKIQEVKKLPAKLC